MHLCIAGKNEISINSVNYLLENSIIDPRQIFILPVKNDYGADTWQLSLKKYAKSKKLKVVKQSDLFNYEDLVFISLDSLAKALYLLFFPSLVAFR